MLTVAVNNYLKCKCLILHSSVHLLLDTSNTYIIIVISVSKGCSFMEKKQIVEKLKR